MRSILSNIEYWKSFQRRFPPNPFALSGVRDDVWCVLLYQPPVCGVWHQTVGPEGKAFPPITPVHVWLVVMSFSDCRNVTANQLRLISPSGACCQTGKGTIGAFGVRVGGGGGGFSTSRVPRQCSSCYQNTFHVFSTPGLKPRTLRFATDWATSASLFWHAEHKKTRFSSFGQMWLCRTHPVVPVLKGGVLSDRVQAVSCFLNTRVCGCGAVQRCRKRRRLPADDCQDGRLYKCVTHLWWAWWEPHAAWVGAWRRKPQPIHLGWRLSDRWCTDTQVGHSSYWSDVDI